MIRDEILNNLWQTLISTDTESESVCWTRSGSAGQNPFYIPSPLTFLTQGLVKGSALQNSSCFCLLSSLFQVMEGGTEQLPSLGAASGLKVGEPWQDLCHKGDLEEQQGLWRTQKVFSVIGCLKIIFCQPLVSEQFIARGLDNWGVLKRIPVWEWLLSCCTLPRTLQQQLLGRSLSHSLTTALPKCQLRMTWMRLEELKIRQCPSTLCVYFTCV